MIKILLTIIGKYLKEIGVDHIFIETELFGPSVVEQVLSGSHYARSVKDFSMLAEALQRIQLQAFFNEYDDLEKYNEVLSDIEALKQAIAEEIFS